MLNKAQHNSDGKLQWGGDKESLYYIAESGNEVHIDVGFLDFGVSTPFSCALYRSIG
jgi:hypothetical protein